MLIEAKTKLNILSKINKILLCIWDGMNIAFNGFIILVLVSFHPCLILISETTKTLHSKLFSDLFCRIVCAMHFGRLLRPSSGAFQVKFWWGATCIRIRRFGCGWCSRLGLHFTCTTSLQLLLTTLLSYSRPFRFI